MKSLISATMLFLTIGIGGALAQTSTPADQPAAGSGQSILSIAVQYTDSDIQRIVEGSLALYSWDGTQWVKESTSQVNTAQNLITAAPNHYGLWAVGGAGVGGYVYLPAAMK